MTQVSRFRLRPDIWEKIFNLFLDTLLSLKKKEKLNAFVYDFFTPTERIVFAKRLAIAVLLAKGNDYSEIRKILRVTPVTISKMSFHLQYEGRGLVPVVEEILKKDATSILWEELLDLLDLPGKGNKVSEWKARKVKRRKTIYEISHEI